MKRKRFNAGLAIKLRKQLNFTQNTFAEKLSKETSISKDLPSISLRTVRELENGYPIDESKGLYIFKELGQEPSEEIYMEEDAPDFIPLDRGMVENAQIWSLLLSEVSFSFGNLETKNWLDSINQSSHYFLHIGDLDEVQQHLVPDLVDFIERRGKILMSKERTSQDWLKLKLADTQLLRKVKDMGIMIFTEVVKDKFTFFNQEEEAKVHDLIYDNSSSELKIYDPRKFFKDISNNPEYISVIAITSRDDRAIREESNNEQDSLKLFISRDFTLDEVFEFLVPPTTFLIRVHENYSEMLVNEEDFTRQFSQELTEYDGPYSPYDDRELLVNKPVMDSKGHPLIHRKQGTEKQVLTKGERFLEEKMEEVHSQLLSILQANPEKIDDISNVFAGIDFFCEGHLSNFQTDKNFDELKDQVEHEIDTMLESLPQSPKKPKTNDADE